MTNEKHHDHTILVVDDEKRMVRFIRLNLEQDGWQNLEMWFRYRTHYPLRLSKLTLLITKKFLLKLINIINPR